MVSRVSGSLDAQETLAVQMLTLVFASIHYSDRRIADIDGPSEW
jgi:hypothetical protein